MAANGRLPRSAWLTPVLLMLLLAGAGLLLNAFGVDLTRLSPTRVQEFVLSFGVWAPAAYLISYGQPIIPLPASIMCIAAGLAFGTGWGMAAAMTAGLIRACASFLIARRLGRQAVAKLLKGHVARLDETIGRNGLMAVILLRLVSGLPYDALNYGLGFTRVAFGPYLLGTIVAMTPVCFAFVFFGHALADPKHLAAVLAVIVTVAALIAAASGWKKRRRAL